MKRVFIAIAVISLILSGCKKKTTEPGSGGNTEKKYTFYYYFYVAPSARNEFNKLKYVEFYIDSVVWYDELNYPVRIKKILNTPKKITLSSFTQDSIATSEPLFSFTISEDDLLNSYPVLRVYIRENPDYADSTNWFFPDGVFIDTTGDTVQIRLEANKIVPEKYFMAFASEFWGNPAYVGIPFEKGTAIKYTFHIEEGYIKPLLPPPSFSSTNFYSNLLAQLLFSTPNWLDDYIQKFKEWTKYRGYYYKTQTEVKQKGYYRASGSMGFGLVPPPSTEYQVLEHPIKRIHIKRRPYQQNS